MEWLLAMAKQQRKDNFGRSHQWSLGQLISELKAVKATDDCSVAFAFGYFVPGGVSSWRGSYDELAIWFKEVEWSLRPKLADFITLLESTVGQSFEGYKGGDFVMGESTPVWVANYGEAGSTGVIGLATETNKDGLAYLVIIRTDYCEF
jgi:hypothetical protein